MRNSKENTEVMQEILELLGITATEEQAQKIAEDFTLHLEMMREVSSTPFIGGIKTCDKCNSYKSEIKRIEEVIEVYKNSVKERRNAEHVWTENGTVMYE